MHIRVLTACLVAVLATAVHARSQQPAPAVDLAGTWNMGLQGDHVVPVALVIEQTGHELKATLTIMQRDIHFTGSLVDRTATLRSVEKVAIGRHGGPGEPAFATLTATLRAGGLLDGELSAGERPAVKLSGERLRERPARTARAAAPRPSVAGDWNMAVTMQGQQMKLALVLKADGNRITGTLKGDHAGEQTVDGTFAAGTLTFTSSSGGGPKLEYSGTLQDDGTLAGRIVTPGGAYDWTARRVRP